MSSFLRHHMKNATKAHPKAQAMPTAPPLRTLLLLALAAWVVGCRTPSEPVAVAEKIVPPPAEVVVTRTATTTRGEFTIEADKLDTWNAIGQIAVRTPGVTYEGRAQMLDLYALRYRGIEFLILTKALPLSDTIKRLTTKVTATTPAGRPIDEDAVAELLTLFQRELPAEIASVRARQAAEREAMARKKNQD